jgi:hypothetical protein
LPDINLYFLSKTYTKIAYFVQESCKIVFKVHCILCCTRIMIAVDSTIPLHGRMIWNSQSPFGLWAIGMLTLRKRGLAIALLPGHRRQPALPSGGVLMASASVTGTPG